MKSLSGPADTTTRDADSPKSAAAMLIRSLRFLACTVSIERRRRHRRCQARVHAIGRPPPGRHPSKSLRDRSHERSAPEKLDEQMLQRALPSRDPAPAATGRWTRSVRGLQVSVPPSSRAPAVRKLGQMTMSPLPWNRRDTTTRSACSRRPTTPMSRRVG